MIKSFVCISSLCVMACGADAVGDDDDAKRILGTSIQEVLVTREGRAFIAVEGGGIITETYEGNRFSVLSDKGSAGRGTFTLNQMKEPKELDPIYAPDPRLPSPPPGEKPEPAVVKCIYSIQGDRMKICYSLKTRPKSFVAADEDFIIELKRKK